MKTITTACVNHKGGVAKTTSLLNLAAGIARLHGKKVCIIDADPQANTTMAAFGEEMASLPQDVMLESVLQEIMQDRPLELKPLTWLDRVDVLPASLDLAAVYTRTKRFDSGRRLYEFEDMLGVSFMRISKSVLINLQYLECVEPTLGGLMMVTLKNGCKECISRKYLPAFKKYLGL